MKKWTFLGLVVLLLYGNCRSNEPAALDCLKMPALTVDGNMSMGCYIDDALWINVGYQPKKSLSEALFIYSQKSDTTMITIRGTFYSDLNNDDLTFEFGMKGFPKIGEIYSGNTPKSSFQISYLPQNNSYYFGSSKTNATSISFMRVDTVNRILSGIFLAKLENRNSFLNPNLKAISLTQGRFDFKTNQVIVP